VRIAGIPRDIFLDYLIGVEKDSSTPEKSFSISWHNHEKE
jgi:hypothetical protein